MEYWKWLGMVVVALIMLGGGWRTEGCLEEERLALFQLKPFFPSIDSRIDGSRLGYYSMMDYLVEENETSSDCCEWEKVKCSSITGRVNHLFLNLTYTVTFDDLVYPNYRTRGNNKYWYLNTSLFLPFKELQSLSLRENSIAGFVDNQGFERLSSKLNKLEILDLSNNYFNDSILTSLSELSSLKSLNLAVNNFIGSNLTDAGLKRLSKLKNLEILDLSGHNYIGNISSQLNDFSSLKSLRLQDCGLVGSIDMLEFNSFINLKELYLGSNEIESLGFSFYDKEQLWLNKLEVLGLSGNLLDSSVFSSLAPLSNLKFLYLNYNNLKGTIHVKDLNAFNYLEELSLSENEVTEFVPSQGLRLMNLTVLELDDNLFKNTILSSLGRLSNLKTLSFGSNLEGTIDIKELDGLSNLEVLDIRCYYSDVGCNLCLQSLDLFPSLKTLSLYGFNFNDSHSQTKLDGLSNLENLDIRCYNSGCNFRLQLLDLFPSLKTLFLYGVNFNDTHSQTNSLNNLEHLRISCKSDFSCNIWLQILDLIPSLKTLSLEGFNFNYSHSQIKWKILTNLEELELWDSSLPLNFIGELPSLKILNVIGCEVNDSLFMNDPLELKNLEFMNIEDTSLENNFLHKIGAMPSIKRLSLMGCGLNGTLHTQGFCGLTNLRDLVMTNNNLEGTLPECFSNFTSLESLDLSYNQLCGNVSALKTLASLRELSLSNNYFQIPSSLGPFFNLSKLKHFDADNNTIYIESEMQPLVPRFQLNRISLSSCGDVGQFPHFLFHQHELRQVYLSNNNFREGFPNWLLNNNANLERLVLANNSLQGHFELPFLPHTDLSYLDVSENSFYSNLPIDIGEKLPSLLFLNMSKNQFHGSIPPSIGDMNFLEALDLSNNQLSDRLPEHLTMGCFSLTSLSLSNNKLQGQMFSSNVNLIKLQELHLDGNHFSGKIPDSLSNCSFLSTLDLSNNVLSGEIPRWMENMSSLSTLDLSNNELSGDIPRWMGSMSSLEEIVMANNHLEGPFPKEFCHLNHLKLLDLSVNNISGSLPSCFSPLWISQVHLSRNKLEGPLKNAFRNSTILVTLDLSNNHLTGKIPNWFGNLSQLSYLLLNNNHFEGGIPVQLCTLGHLSLIDLSNNNLSGTIPPCLKITTLNEISQEYVRYVTDIAQAPNSFSIDEPVEFTVKSMSYSYKGIVLTYLSGIDLSCNKLTGEIPSEVNNLRNIYALNLSHNNLIGLIPLAFSNLKQIESLDLSHNNLSGKIPPQLVGLYRLSYFSVAYNNLSGSTPAWTAQFATFDESSYVGNPLLCGEPLKDCLTSGPSASLLPKASPENGLIDMISFYVTFVVSYVMAILSIACVLYINPYWRQAWFYYVGAISNCCYYFLKTIFCLKGSTVEICKPM
ncbi:hypothetical protein J1N35_032811 [Gossypium stocksii]|uniref:Leucine-rich repeat-containing N-terminal plant-type domain-containing protein n=1 Tax=Gossypium stocksii TaxID=47602 RepID=A0A9D3ZX52_9ROSI|nr:hypothetical protein J1N35_032811 [Gossypium stocksii]